MPRQSDAPADEAGASDESWDESQDQATEETPAKQSQANELVEIATNLYDLGISDLAEPFAVPKQGSKIVRMLRGGRFSFRAELASLYKREHDKVPSQAALTSALLVLEGMAASTEPQQLHLRVARHGRKIVVDLGDPSGRVAVIRPGKGFKIRERSPVLFRRTELTNALPLPEIGETIDVLLSILNVAKEDWDVLVAFLIAALIPDIPHPILLLTGEQGTAKTTAERFLGRLVDPSPAETRQAPRDIEQWAVAAAGSYFVPMDNLSWLPPWLSDALCRASTGEGVVRRRLFSDGGVTVLNFRRVVILNAIDAGAIRGDLAERLVVVELERIPETDRRLDAELEEAFRGMHPVLLGALFELLSEVLAILPTTLLDSLPRMADFARVVRAVDDVRGTNAWDTYVQNGERVSLDVLEGDPVALAVKRFMAKRRKWEGTTQELFNRVREPDDAKRWPPDAQRFGARLKRAAPALRSAGVEFEARLATTPDRTKVITLRNPSAPKRRKKKARSQ